jgi:hypothetical protein
MARPSYFAQAAGRASRKLPELTPPSALLARWQMAAAAPLEPEPAGRGTPATSAARADERAGPIAARQPASGVRPVPASPGTMRIDQQANARDAAAVRVVSPPQVEAISENRVAAGPGKVDAPGPRAAQGADGLPQAHPVPPSTAAVRAPQVGVKQPVDNQSPVVIVAATTAAQRPAHVQERPVARGAFAPQLGEAPQAAAAAATIAPPSPPSAASQAGASPPAFAVLTPAVPAERPPLAAPSATQAREAAPLIRIGSVEVQIAPAASPPPATRPAAVAPRPRAALSRELISTYGLRQG